MTVVWQFGFVGQTDDVAQDVPEDMSGAAEDRDVEVFILPIAIFQRWRTDSSRPSPIGAQRWLASGAYA